MTQRAAGRLAWLFWLLVVLAEAASVALRGRNDPATLVIDAFGALVQLTFVTIGAFIISRRFENAIGWIFVAIALLDVAGDVSLEYAVYSLITAPGTLAGGAWAAYLGDGLRTSGFVLTIGYVLLLFPDGRLPSPRWRLAGWLPVLALAANVLAEMLSPAPNDLRLQSAPNPLGVNPSPAVPGLLGLLSILLMAACVIAGATAAIARFRRSQGDERQQIKWFVYAAVLGTGLIVGLLAATALNLNVSPALGGILFPLALAGIPIATGIAILKYRLYAIDLLIRRTLLYSVLTALLAAVYFGSVVVLQGLLTVLTPLGGASAGAAGAARSELVTVLSTLAIAALFVPLRGRLQTFIDRRYYRRRYDAAQTLAGFAQAARDEVDLDRLSDELVRVVQDTLQPETASLWLARPADGMPPGKFSGN
jgi:hypothetical protein